MPPPEEALARPRAQLDRERVVQGAVSLADRFGLEGLTIRKLATALDTKPMTIYHHVPNKEAIIDGMVDRVFAEIDLPPSGTDWKTAMTHRVRSARAVLARHPWATPLMDARPTQGPATLAHHDAVIGCCRGAGSTAEMTADALSLIDAFVYGFALQEANLPATSGSEMAELAGGLAERFADGRYPHLVEFTVDHVLQPGYDFNVEFDFGLELILAGLAAALDRHPSDRGPSREGRDVNPGAR